jgi:hypothetical protein
MFELISQLCLSSSQVKPKYLGIQAALPLHSSKPSRIDRRCREDLLYRQTADKPTHICESLLNNCS